MRAFTPHIPDTVRPLKVQIDKNKPLDIEIGAGAGLFAITHAKNNKDRQLISIEHTKERFERLQKRKKAHPDLENLKIVHANAISWIAAHCQPESVDHIYLLYPNPWPKKKHQNQRWHQMPFMGFLLNCLKSDGKLTMATNLEWYKEEALFWFEKRWLRRVTCEKVVPGGARTHFERKYLARGESCFNLEVGRL